MAKQDEPNKVAYSMVGVGRVRARRMLENIDLGCFRGARIGADSTRGAAQRPRVDGTPRATLPALALFSLLLLAPSVRAAGPDGTWTGTWTKNGDALPVVVTLVKDGGSLSGW